MVVPLIFDISGGELIVILLFVLLFFGSKGIPDVARTMGRTLRQLRDATADVQREIEKGAADVKRGYADQRKMFQIEPPEHTSSTRPSSPSEQPPEGAPDPSPERPDPSASEGPAV